MDTTLDMDIRQAIYRYRTGEIDRHSFEDWFVAATWDAIALADAPRAALIGAVELALAEYTAGHASIAELRDDLRAALQTIVVGEHALVGGSDATIIYRHLEPLVTTLSV